MQYQKKKILILHTGGTFGMNLGSHDEALKESDSFLGDLLTRIPELKEIADIELDILCNIDSSDAGPDLWIRLAQHIDQMWENFHGFVIIHGTDTMAWSASALHFLLEDLTKPVIFTGSQRPLTALRNDARANLIDAVELATLGFPHVMVCFDSHIYHPLAVSKHSSEHLKAFESYNKPLLGRFGVNLRMNRKLVRAPLALEKCHKPQLNPALSSNILCLSSIPRGGSGGGLGASATKWLQVGLLEHLDGFVVRGFGAGNLSLKSPFWGDFCALCLERQLPVVMTSQCPAGQVDLGLYENGRFFKNLGVISAGKLTLEAATVKLMVMLGRNIPFEQRHDFFLEKT